MENAVILLETLKLCGRLFQVLRHSDPGRGFPIVRSLIAVLESIATDPRAESVGPVLYTLMSEVNTRAPGAVRHALRASHEEF